MPRGIYNRKAKAPNQEATIAARPEAIITPTAAIAAFSTQLGAMHRQSLTVACSAAVCFVVGVHAAVPIEQDALVTKIKAATSRLGLGDAQVAKYLALAQALVRHIMHRFKVGGPIAEVLAADTPEKATNALASYLTKQKVMTLEGLTVMFSKYRRSSKRKVTATVTKLVAAAPVLNETQAQAALELSPPVQPELSQELVQGAVDQSLSVKLKTLPIEFIIRLSVQAGHTLASIATTAISLMTAESDLNVVMEKLVWHRSRLSAAPLQATPGIRQELQAAH